MSGIYLGEIQKWMNLLNKARAIQLSPLSLRLALELRRRTYTNRFIKPEKALEEMEKMGLVCREDKNGEIRIYLSDLASYWIRESNEYFDWKPQYLQHLLHSYFLKEWVNIKEIRDCLLSFTRTDQGVFMQKTDLRLPPHLDFESSMLFSLQLIQEDENYFWISTNDFNEIQSLVQMASMTEEELYKKLDHQREVGREGEDWVIDYERNRLRKKYPERHENQHVVKRVSEKSVNEGYDVYSMEEEIYDEERYIDAKTNRDDDLTFFITENERRVASKKGNRYWIYFLSGKKKGKDPKHLIQIQNPEQWFKENDILIQPIVYKVTLTKEIITELTQAEGGNEIL